MKKDYTNVWRLIDRIDDGAQMQMAIDEAITISCSKGKSLPTLRFYTFKPAGITIGYHQKIDNFNFDEINKKGFGFARRMSGGTAVLHKDDLVYALIIPEDFLPSKIVDAYKYLSDGLILGLNNFGLNSYKRDTSSKRREDSCYLNSNPYDVVINDKKISGNAQTRINGVVLQHGTIIVKNNISELINCINLDSENRKVLFNESLKKITSIEDEFQRTISLKGLEGAMLSGFERLFREKGIILEKGTLSDYELNLAKKLYGEKYSKDDWNFKR